MDKIKKKSFAGQLKKGFILIIMIPVLCLGSFILYSSARYVKEEKTLEINNSIDQNEIDLKNRMEQCERSIIYAVSNYTLQEFMQIDTGKYLELANAAKSVGPLLYNNVLSSQYYKKLRIYTEKKYNIMDDLIHLDDQVKEETWYKKTMQSEETCWWFENDSFFITKVIKTSYPVKTLGIMKVDLDSRIFRSSFNVFQNTPINISLSKAGDSFYEYKNVKEDFDSGFARSDELGNSGWTVTYQVDKRYFSQNLGTGIVAPMLIIFAVLCLVWLAVHIFSKLLLKDMMVLVSEVNEVQKGDFDVIIEPSEIEEVDILAKSLQGMMNRIKQLIRQVYAKEIERQGIELDLLQAKINPHFLYNNLSAINWLALESGQDRIYEITTEMAAFYRTALNKGKNVDKLSVEIANIKAYIRLQQISHEDSFDVEYKLEEALMEDNVPIFILQPLVENAIEHGVDQLREGRGEISISARKDGKYLVLNVCDNGDELYKKIGRGAMKTEDYGYGTSNVHRRVQLLCGKDCGLTVSADETGTRSVVRLRTDRLTMI
ncbi:histidine kinase [Blautia schinkii]|nr:histidine kinase [Blautia schinkii]